MAPERDKVYVVILNFNGWEDTIECLESAIRSSERNFQLVVVDNDSSNHSMDYIEMWCRGTLLPWVPQTNPLRKLTVPPTEKPLPYVRYDRVEAERGGSRAAEAAALLSAPSVLDFPVVLIQSGANLGFSGGNNVGIRYAMAKDDFAFLWLLNNDTVIAENALERLHRHASRQPEKTGIIGSLLLYYDRPDTVQAYGGRFNPWFVTSTHNLQGEKYGVQAVGAFDTANVDFIVGASMLISNRCLRDVGLLDEAYFIYFEEIDMATRAKKQGYALDICPESIVYHKVGATIEEEKSRISEFSDFYAIRNRKVFALKHSWRSLPFLYAGMLLSLFNRLKRHELKKAGNILKIMFGKMQWTP